MKVSKNKKNGIISLVKVFLFRTSVFLFSMFSFGFLYTASAQGSEKESLVFSNDKDVSSSIELKKSAVDNFNINFNFRNMHTWHGMVVTPGAMLAASMEYISTDGAFVVGLWGGSSFDGSYKEFTYYTSYQFNPSFKLSLISHNNYSNSENPNIFSYNKFTSPNFVDIIFEYTISEQLPLNIYWSTILFGNGGDYEENDDGSVTDSYSNYVQLSYDVFSNNNTTVSTFVGGAFSLSTEKTFYSNSASVINVGVKLDKKVKLFSKEVPVSLMGFWNPETKIGALQLDIKIF